MSPLTGQRHARLSPTRLEPARLLAGLAGVALAWTSLVPAQAAPTEAFPQRVYDQLVKDQQRINSAVMTDSMRQDATFRFDPRDAVFRFDAQDATIPPATTVVDEDTQTIRLTADVLFEFGSAELTPAATSKIPEFIADVPTGATIEVNGHTDSIGTDADNQALSEQRALAVAGAIASARPDLAITTNGYGETQPVAPNTNDDGTDNPIGRSHNRRVEIVYQG